MRWSIHPSFGSEARGVLFPRRRGSTLAPILLMTLALGACASGPAAPTVGSSPSPVSTPAPSAATQRFPRTVTDDEGTPIHLSTQPERIVSLTPGTTEILFAVGAADRVVATDDASDYPPEATALDHVASFGEVDLERIVALETDLVIAGGNEYTPSEAIASLRNLDIPVLVAYAASVDGVVADVRLVGEAIGSEAEAEEVAAQMETELEALSAAVADAPTPRVFYEIDASVDLYGPADDSFLADMLERAGADAITTGSSLSFLMDLERLVEADPEVIVLGDAAFGVTPEGVAARDAWKTMTAVQEGAVRPVDDKLVTRPGPRLALGLRSLILAIHPEARLP